MHQYPCMDMFFNLPFMIRFAQHIRSAQQRHGLSKTSYICFRQIRSARHTRSAQQRDGVFA